MGAVYLPASAALGIFGTCSRASNESNCRGSLICNCSQGDFGWRHEIGAFRAVYKQAVQELEGEHLMDLGGVIPVSSDVPSYHGLDFLSGDIRSGKAPRIKEHVFEIGSQEIAIPHAKVECLMAA